MSGIVHTNTSLSIQIYCPLNFVEWVGGKMNTHTILWSYWKSRDGAKQKLICCIVYKILKCKETTVCKKNYPQKCRARDLIFLQVMTLTVVSWLIMLTWISSKQVQIIVIIKSLFEMSWYFPHMVLFNKEVTFSLHLESLSSIPQTSQNTLQWKPLLMEFCEMFAYKWFTFWAIFWVK